MTYRVTAFNQSNPSEAAKGEINWQIRCDVTDFRTWEKENRIQAVADKGHTMTYKYNDTGERVITQGPQGETVYVNQFFTIRNREAGTPRDR